MHSMLILIFVIGYIVIAAIAVMAVITFACGVALAFGVYALVYAVLYAWAYVGRRTSPTWKFSPARFPVSLEIARENALIAGILSLAFMAFGFFAYAVNGGNVSDAAQLTVCFAAVAGLAWWADKVKSKSDADIDA